jgi:hypothetical protein
MEELTIEDVNVSTLKNIFNLIDDNHFLVSTDLIEKYRVIYDLYRNSTHAFDFMYNVGDVDDPKKEWEKVKDEFYQNYKKSIEDFFNVIEKEINKMKKVIED